MMWFFVELVVFCRACGFLSSLWFFVELVVFWRACGFLASLWFFGELVVFWRACGSLFPSRGKGQTAKDLTTESVLC